MEEFDTKLVHSFSRGNGEEIQFSLRCYRGQIYADIRIWYQSKNENSFLPTKKGISFKLDQLEQLRQGISNLCEAAERCLETVNSAEPAEEVTPEA